MLKNLLLILFFPVFTHGVDINFKSKELSSLFKSTSSQPAINYKGFETCEVFHSQARLKNLDKVDIKNLEDVKKFLFTEELKNADFWKKQFNITLDEKKMMPLDDFMRSTIFININNVLDGIYCFLKLGRDSEKLKSRKEIMKKINSYKDFFSFFIYYEDGSELEENLNFTTARLLIIYVLDQKTKEVYGIKGTELF